MCVFMYVCIYIHIYIYRVNPTQRRLLLCVEVSLYRREAERMHELGLRGQADLGLRENRNL